MTFDLPASPRRAPALRRLRSRLLASGLLALLPLVNAQAQEKDAPAGDGLNLTLGAGLAVVSKFPGSDDRKTRAMPMVALDYGRFFLGPVPGAGGLGLGMDLWRSQGLRLGVAFSSEFSELRKESDDSRLQGLGDVKGTQHATLFGGYDAGRWALRGAVASDIGGEHQGTVATLEGELRFMPAAGWMLAVGPGLSWQNREGMQTLWGIDAAQSLRSGQAEYRAGAGLSQWQLNASAMYQLDSHWRLGARAAYVRLQGDAADSPLAFDRTQNVFSLFALYRF